VKCEVLDGIECYGDRVFMSIKEFPCIKYEHFIYPAPMIRTSVLAYNAPQMRTI